MYYELGSERVNVCTQDIHQQFAKLKNVSITKEESSDQQSEEQWDKLLTRVTPTDAAEETTEKK